MTGMNENGGVVRGVAYKDYEAGEAVIRFQYTDGNCNVGGNPGPSFEGCTSLSLVTKYHILLLN